MLSRRDRIREKIMACVEIVDTGYETPCHLWTAGDSGNGRGGGYPRMWLDGQVVAVHIVAWTNEHGYVPGKKQLDHLCRQRRCVREDHLELVTHRENQKRRDRANGVARKRRTRKTPAQIAAPFDASEIAPCAACGKGLMHNGSIVFYELTMRLVVADIQTKGEA